MSDVVKFRPPPPPSRDTTSFVGMAIFLGAWAMTFAALFFAYFDVRIAARAWPDVAVTAPLGLPALNTLVLVGSSVTLMLGLRAVRAADPAALRRWLVVTLALGTAFVALQVVVWRQLLGEGLRWDSGQYGSIFYLLTGFHALHVLVGLVGLLTLLPGALAGRFTVQKHARVRNWAMFWHFVDAIWVVMFFTLYVF
jgi:heme/copper-type cytochrome/quinol oxidase subunit 3